MKVFRMRDSGQKLVILATSVLSLLRGWQTDTT